MKVNDKEFASTNSQSWEGDKKAKRYDSRREPKRLEGVQYATGKEQRIAPKRVKRLRQSENDTKL